MHSSTPSNRAISAVRASVSPIPSHSLMCIRFGRHRMNLFPRAPHFATHALVNAVESRHLGGARLAVTDRDPPPHGHPLWTAPNVLMSPHTGYPQAMGAPLLGGLVTENVRRWIDGAELTAVI